MNVSPKDALRPADFARVRDLAAGDMRRVDALIRARLSSDVLLINQIADHIVAGGGKRLRPTLHVLAAGAAGYRGEQHIKLAAVIEFIHTSTLLHDDVVDESDLRRGRKTANALWGNAASVLVGDFLYSRSFQLMVELDDMRIMRILADTTNTIAEGEVLQLLNIGNAGVSEAAYLAVIERKTAVLFAAATELGGILGGLVDRDGLLLESLAEELRREVWPLAATGKLRPIIDSTYALADAAASAACRRIRLTPCAAMAWNWATPSRSPTTCSTTSAMPARWARTSATT